MGKRRNVNPAKWGPSTWEVMHTITFSYPEDPSPEQQQEAISLFMSMAKMLPCDTCAAHFEQAITETLPIQNHVDSRDSLSRWLVEVHNLVNRRLGKPELSYEEAKEIYVNRKNECMIQSSHSTECSPASPPSPKPSKTTPSVTPLDSLRDFFNKRKPTTPHDERQMREGKSQTAPSLLLVPLSTGPLGTASEKHSTSIIALSFISVILLILLVAVCCCMASKKKLDFIDDPAIASVLVDRPPPTKTKKSNFRQLGEKDTNNNTPLRRPGNKK